MLVAGKEVLGPMSTCCSQPKHTVHMVASFMHVTWCTNNRNSQSGHLHFQVQGLPISHMLDCQLPSETQAGT